MRMQWKIVAIAAFSGVASAGSVAWRMQSTLGESQRSRAAAVAAREANGLRKLARARLEALRAELVREAAVREAAGKSFLTKASPFEAMALAKPSGSGTDANGTWTVAWKETAPEASTDRWTGGFDATAIASLRFARAKDGEIVWARVADAKGDPAFAMFFEAELSPSDSAQKPKDAPALPESRQVGVSPIEKRAIVAAIFRGNPLASAAEGGAEGEAAFLFDDQGYVAAHPDPRAAGASFQAHALVAEATKKQKAASEGEYQDADGRQVWGRFEAVPGTNLWAARTAPAASARGSFADDLESAIAFGMAAAIFSAGIAIWIGSRGRQGSSDEILGDLAPTDGALHRGHAGSAASERDEGVRPAQAAPGPASAGGAGPAFGDALRGPLAAIIGHAQLAKAKAPDAEVRLHAEAIERDARAAKDALEKFARLSSPPVARAEPVSLTEVLDAAVESLRTELSANAVTIVRRYEAQPVVEADPALLQSAFARVIENAVHAMANRERRTLALDVEPQGTGVRVRIGDTGVGFTREARERAFEPFFRQFEGSNRMGLGLSFARQAFEACGANATIESAPGEGATVWVAFRNGSNARLDEPAPPPPPRAPSRARELEVTPVSSPFVSIKEEGSKFGRPTFDDASRESEPEAEEAAAVADIPEPPGRVQEERALPLGLENLAAEAAALAAEFDDSGEPEASPRPPPLRAPPAAGARREDELDRTQALPGPAYAPPAREEQLDKTMVLPEAASIASSLPTPPAERAVETTGESSSQEKFSVRIRRPKLRG